MLATTAQVATILGRDLTAEETARAAELIPMVQESIEARLGRSAEGAAYTDVVFTVPHYSRTLLLPHWPLASVGTITGEPPFTGPAGYDVDLNTGILTRIVGNFPAYWHPGTGAVVIGYTSATIGELSTLCAKIVARALTASAATAATSIVAGFRQLTIGRWSGTKDTGADPVEAITPTAADLEVVDSWRDRLA